MNRLFSIMSWLIALVIPFVLIMTSIRLLLTPVFLDVEYRTPGFPADTYGFSLEDRLYWARISVDYLTNNADLSFLSSRVLADGSPLYNERELSHMEDVKILVQQSLGVFYLVLGTLLLIGLWAYAKKWKALFWQGVSLGGWLTIGLVFGILVFVALNFDALFTSFHRIFFEGDTWLFAYSDTLIRLFPIRFWQDAFIFMGVITIGGALLAAYLGRRLARND
jgi:integral membrane protein (TIGR01906 family)